jgi:adenylate cyclase
MADLTAQGPQEGDRWRRSLQQDSVAVIGRQGGWQVDWDDRISRQHATLKSLAEDQIEVEKFPEARNSIFFQGKKLDRFKVRPGEHFVIGRTTFTVAVKPIVAESSQSGGDVAEHTFAVGMLRESSYVDASRRIEALGELPELIKQSTSDSELLVRVTGVLMHATLSAAAVAVLRVAETIEILHYDCRLPGLDGPRPSGRLARQAAESGESVLHIWNRVGQSGSRNQFTAHDDVDWAFAVPVLVDACPGWVLYVTGEASGVEITNSSSVPAGLQDDVKFTELVATMLGNLRQNRSLQQRQAKLSRFFAPVVMNALAGGDALEVLKPREADIAVLFCDLRGFSRKSEEQAENLLGLLERVSEALGIMTRNILHRDGVIGDFHGDAAMGFWGWPLAQTDAAGRACRTALEILAEFQRQGAAEDRPLGGFRCGIGIATGRAVAGRIGTSDQVKVTAFGPVVNLASRLEGMTKVFSTEILVDEPTADFVRKTLSTEIARVRRLAKVRPAGMQTPLVIHQLLPPAGVAGAPSDADIAAYELALESLFNHQWELAFEQLHRVPANDRAKDFLTVFIASHGRVPPENWDGVISLPKK